MLAKRYLLTSLIFLSLLLISGSFLFSKSKNTEAQVIKDYQDNEILVKLKDGNGSPNQVIKKNNLSVQTLNRIEKDTPSKTSSGIFKLKTKEDPAKAALRLNQDPKVEYAEPNYKLSLATTPNDPKFSEQWGLSKINMPSAWKIGTGSTNINIAIIDTGVDWDHPDLADNIWENSDETENELDSDDNGYIDDVRGWDFVTQTNCYPGEDCTGNPDNDPMDFHGHGTSVSGVASAATNNEVGIAGAGWKVKIMALRAGYARAGDGKGELLISDAANAVRYAADNGADIINLSWGGEFSSTIKQAIDYAINKNVLVVAAVGNQANDSDYYPASLNNVLSVGGTDSSDNRWSSSNYGTKVNISAPAKDIYSTTFDDTYTTASGTSLSAPLVAGVAGLVKSKYPSITRKDLTNRLVTNAEYIGNLGIGSRLSGLSFTSTKRHPDGSIIRAKGQASVYLIREGKRVAIPSPNILTSRYRWNDINTVSYSELVSYPRDGILGFKDGTLIRPKGGGTVYIVEDGKVRGFNSANVFTNKGYKWKNIIEEKEKVIDRAHNSGNRVTASSKHPDGTLIRIKNRATVYRLQDGKRWPITSPSVFKSNNFRWQDVVDRPYSTVVSFPKASFWPCRSGSLLRIKGKATVYYLQNNIRRSFSSAARFEDLDYKWNRIHDVSSSELYLYKGDLLPKM